MHARHRTLGDFACSRRVRGPLGSENRFRSILGSVCPIRITAQILCGHLSSAAATVACHQGVSLAASGRCAWSAASCADIVQWQLKLAMSTCRPAPRVRRALGGAFDPVTCSCDDSTSCQPQQNSIIAMRLEMMKVPPLTTDGT